MKKILRFLVGLLLLLIGCSDNGGRHTAGIEGTGDRVASGVITSFGSVVVNGIHFATSSAEIAIEGDFATEDDLQPGMVVEIDGTITDTATGQARRIRYQPLLRGPISEVTTLGANRKQLLILGQNVQLAEDSVVSGTGFEALAAGDWVEISGLRGPDMLLATRLSAADAGAGYMLAGTVAELQTSQQQLRIGDQWITYADAELRDLAGEPVLEAYLQVEGQTLEDGVLQATRVTDLTALSFPGGRKLAVEGLVQNLAGPVFQLQELSVDTSGAEFKRATADALIDGIRVSVVGTLATDGMLEAERVVILPPGTSRWRGAVADLQPASGALELLGARFDTDNLTGFIDKSASADRYFKFEDLQLSDVIEIHAAPAGDQWQATRMERLDDVGTVTLKGPVTGILSDTEIRVMGVTVDISGISEELRGTLEASHFVTVEGLQSGARLVTATDLIIHERPACGGAACAAGNSNKNEGAGP